MTRTNTSHDNNSMDRVQNDGGSVANINCDGTFTHENKKFLPSINHQTPMALTFTHVRVEAVETAVEAVEAV